MKLSHLSDVPKTIAHDDLLRQQFVKPGDLKSAIQTVNYAELAEGQSFIPHAHPDCEECFFVIEGEAEAVIGDNSCALNKGDFLVVEQNEIHSFTNHSSEIFRYLQFRVLI
jgi:mannose-6-phosphate isomerase-like protein (cupin superfamily)